VQNVYDFHLLVLDYGITKSKQEKTFPCDYDFFPMFSGRISLKEMKMAFRIHTRRELPQREMQQIIGFLQVKHLFKKFLRSY
jgi:hypothetical protein